MATIFELCCGDLTKMDEVTERNFLETLNWLSYHKEKNDLINEKTKHRQ